MLSFFAPRYLKEARLVLKNARKLLHYKRDLLTPGQLAELEAAMARLERAERNRDQTEVQEATQDLDKQWGRHFPAQKDAEWRENCEVFLVAIVVAIGMRTYFLQPFTIPTGSMQPTLNGIVGTPTETPPPALPRQAFDFVMRGRNYIDVVAKSDDVITGMRERKLLYFFSLTDVQCQHSAYTVWAPLDTLQRSFRVLPGRPLHAGEAFARGYIDAGDHVFVDKVSYSFRPPERGEIIVFKTSGIRIIEDQLRRQGIEGSEFYIKRLAGVPGDTLRIDSPLLFVNGQEAQEFGFQRVMKLYPKIYAPSYPGYSNPHPWEAMYLTAPDATYTVPAQHYFAMGDNSFNSFDSRYWGPVPQDNMTGRGMFVYWPFFPHWGFVR